MTQAETLRRAAERTARLNADVALLCEHALTAADRLEVLEREHSEFYESWHMELRRRTELELLLREVEPELNEWDFPITLVGRVRAALGLPRHNPYLDADSDERG